MTPPTPIEPLMAELASVKNYLIAAQEVLKDGFMPDITALEGRVAGLCQQIQKAPKELHEKCLPELLIVLEHLDECEKNMHALHEAQAKAEKP